MHINGVGSSLNLLSTSTKFGLGSSDAEEPSSVSLFGKFSGEQPDLYAATLSILSYGAALGEATSSTSTVTESSTDSQASILDSIQERLTTLQGLYEQGAEATTEEERAQVQKAIDSTIADISTLASVSLSLGSTQYAQVSELNPDQVVDLNVLELDSNSSVTLEGTVTQAAERAQLTVLGTDEGEVSETVNVNLGGSLGNVSMTWEKGESLESVAKRVNELAEATGVVAAVKDSVLVLTSTSIGSESKVSLNATTVSSTVEVTNVNADQISGVSTSQFETGQSLDVSGEVIQASERAEVRYVGDGAGYVNGSATVKISGNEGTAEVEFEYGETLESVADKINKVASETGVTASVEDNQLVMRSIKTGSDAFVSVDGGASIGEISVSGANADQITSATVNRASAGLNTTLEGEVVTSADYGRLTLTGTESGKVISDATFKLSGAKGSVTIEVDKRESLSTVATRINNKTEKTGVTARVEDNKLILESTELGSEGFVDVEVLAVDQDIDVDGKWSWQIDDVDVLSMDANTEVEISGEVTQLASDAEMTLKVGSGNKITANATITIEGKNGSVEVKAFAGENVSKFANRVEDALDDLDIDVDYSGNYVTFETDDEGGSEFVNFTVKSGSIAGLSAGQSTSATGQDAKAVINGQEITGVGNRLTVELDEVTFEMEIDNDFTGTFHSFTIESDGGFFDIEGADENGSSYGTDVEVLVDGQTYTGSGNDVTISTDEYEVDLSFASGFSGSFDPLTIQGESVFEVAGGEGEASDFGQDIVVELNGQKIEGKGSEVTLETEYGNVDVGFVEGYVGSVDTFTIGAVVGEFTVLGTDESTTVYGKDVVVEFGGQEYVGVGNQVTVGTAEATVELEFAEGFSGELDPITISGTELESDSLLDASGEEHSELMELAEALAPYISGGEFAVGGESFADGKQTLDDIVKELASLQIVGEQESEETEVVSLTDQQLTEAREAAAHVAEAFQQYLLTDTLLNLDSMGLQSYLDDSGRQRVVELLR